ncbi:MAG: c-type cytochrome [Ferruginibacter sp.]|nr:c-type cytochrome [Ferruginibacter sp.]
MQRKNIFTRFNWMLALALLAQPALAQDAATPAASGGSGNLLAALMIVVTIILAFVIWGMGNVLLTLGKETLRRKKSGTVVPIIVAAMLSLISFSAQAQEAAAPVAAVSRFNYGGLSAMLFWLLLIVIFIELVTIFFLLFMIRRFQQELQPEAEKAKESTFSEWWTKFDKKFFTKAVPVEKEADVMLDHEYDGIRELDNALPPWWKYGFYVTIIGSVIYLFYFHVGNGLDPIQEYEREMENAAFALAKYNAASPDKIDENNITLSDAAGIEEGKRIYNMACWACHGKLGEGGAGPNLTDEYWIHKGGLNDIYRSIKIGYPDKGMQSWEKNYSPKEISNLTSYIKTLAGTNPPNARAPQGDIWKEEAPVAAEGAPAADSTKNVSNP